MRRVLLYFAACLTALLAWACWWSRRLFPG
jgi:hypothetical protein